MEQIIVGRGSGWRRNPLEGSGDSLTGATSLLRSNSSGMEEGGDYPIFIPMKGGIS